MIWLMRAGVLGLLWMVRRSEAPLARRLRELSFTDKGKFAWRLAQDRRVPPAVKALAVVPAAYIASPIDILPDFLPGIGKLDDALVFDLFANAVVRLVPASVLLELLDFTGPIPLNQGTLANV